MFKRIGGYAGPGGYAIYSEGGVEHHSEIHVIEWDINDTNTLYSGTDGGAQDNSTTIEVLVQVEITNRQ